MIAENIKEQAVGLKASIGPETSPADVEAAVRQINGIIHDAERVEGLEQAALVLPDAEAANG